MPFVLAKKSAFLLSVQGCLFLFIGGRVLACLSVFLGSGGSCLLEQGKETKAHSLLVVVLVWF